MTEEIEDNPPEGLHSIYDQMIFLGKSFQLKIKKRLFCLFVAKRVFSVSPPLIYLLNLFRVPLKNTFETYFANFIENKTDDLLNDEENIISVIHALRGKYFLNENQCSERGYFRYDFPE